MKFRKRNRKKSKINPSSLCECCQIKIFDKKRNSIYCKKCVEIVHDVKEKIRNVIYRLEDKYPQFKIKYYIMIKKNEK